MDPNASDIDKLKAIKINTLDVQCMLRISCKDHGTNESVLNEVSADRKFVANIRKQKLQYFGNMIRAQNLCRHILKVDWMA